MGEIADSIINGDFDYITGEWLGEGGGFPRTRVQYENENNAKNGIIKWVHKHLPGVKPKIVRRKYATEVLKNSSISNTELTEAIQSNFKAFRTWAKSKGVDYFKQ